MAEHTTTDSTGVIDRVSGATLSTPGTLETLVWSAVLAGLLADLVTTTAGLQIGLTEGNPVMRWALATVGPAALVGFKLPIVAVAAALRVYRVDYGLAAALALAVLWNVVAVVNLVAIL